MNFSGIYQNCRGLKTKHANFKLNILQNDYDFICISETWLNDSWNSSELFDDRYCVYRSDSKYNVTLKSDGAGTLIALKHVFSSVGLPSIGQLFEDTWVKVTLKNGNILLMCCLYMPCTASFNEYKLFFDYVSKLSVDYYKAKFIITGDFNLPCIRWEEVNLCYCEPYTYEGRASEALINMMEFVRLKQFNNIRNSNNRTLDLVLSNIVPFNFIKVEATNPLVHPDNHHPPLSISLKLSPLKLQPRCRNSSINFLKLNYDRISTDMKRIKWYELFDNLDSVDECVKLLYSEIFRCINSSISDDIPNNKKINSYPSWFSNSLIKLLKLKLKAHNNLKIFKSDIYKFRFELLRLEVKREIDKCYTSYRSNIEKNVFANPNTFFKFVKSSSKKSNYPKCMKFEDSSSECMTDICNWFAENFKSVYDNVIISDDYIEEKFSNLDANQFFLSNICISNSDISHAIDELDIKKGGGPDGVPNYFIVKMKNELILPLSIIFNKSLKLGFFPSKWKECFITPVLKKGDSSYIKNYRPISILNSFSKLFEKIIHKYLFQFFKNRIDCNQHGFVKNKSTITNLVEFTDYICENIDLKYQVDCVYTDFSSAFDRVNIKILLFKLKQFGISHILLDWIKSYLSERILSVKVNGKLSFNFSPTSGVPQGSILGPLLFLIFINDIGCNFKSRYLLYADDLKIFHRIKSEQDCLQLQMDLDTLNYWCTINRLFLNIGKCETISFTKNINKIVFNYKILSSGLQRNLFVMDLGVLFDCSLRFDLHVEKICKKGFKMLGFILRRGREFLNPSVLVHLYKCFVRCQLEYCVQVWQPFYTLYMDKIERIQRKFTKFIIYKYFPTTSAISYNIRLSRCNLITLHLRRTYLTEIFLYKLVNNLVSSAVLSCIRLYAPAYRTRNSQLFLLSISRVNISYNSPMNKMQGNHNSMFSELDLFSEGLLAFKKKVLAILN